MVSGSVPRTFLSPAFLVEVEPATFGLFRSLEVEVSFGREKVKDIGPIGLFRRCEGPERPDLRTVDPATGAAVDLKRIS